MPRKKTTTTATKPRTVGRPRAVETDEWLVAAVKAGCLTAEEVRRWCVTKGGPDMTADSWARRRRRLIREGVLMATPWGRARVTRAKPPVDEEAEEVSRCSILRDHQGLHYVTHQTGLGVRRILGVGYCRVIDASLVRTFVLCLGLAWEPMPKGIGGPLRLDKLCVPR